MILCCDIEYLRYLFQYQLVERNDTESLNEKWEKNFDLMNIPSNVQHLINMGIHTLEDSQIFVQCPRFFLQLAINHYFFLY